MMQTTSKSQFVQGVLAGLPFAPVIVPFATLFGVVGTEVGLSLLEVMGFSVLVIAGTAQFTALQLMLDQAPTLVVITMALVVNLRMAMYSAALTPHVGAAPLWLRAVLSYVLVDQSYTVATLRFEQEPEWTLSQKIAYFFGVVTPVAPLWYGFSLIGALVGASLPLGLGLDFAVPLTFIAMIAPALRTTAHKVAAFVAVVLGLVFAFVPYNGGLIIAGLGAMMAGAEVERRGGWSA